MMLNLYLMRLARSTPNEGAYAYDAERPISEEGRGHARDVARFMRNNKFAPTRILCGPFLRTRQTAEVLAEELGSGVEVNVDTLLLPGSGTSDLLKAVSKWHQYDKRPVMAVLHEPDVSYMLAKFTMKKEEYPIAIYQGDFFALKVSISADDVDARLFVHYSPIKRGEF